MKILYPFPPTYARVSSLFFCCSRGLSDIANLRKKNEQCYLNRMFQAPSELLFPRKIASMLSNFNRSFHSDNGDDGIFWVAQESS